MSSYIDLKFISEISARLGLFKKKSDYLYNFRCPHCGDSQKSKLKARGYMYRKKNDMFFKCHNCGMGQNLANFLKFIDPKVFFFKKFVIPSPEVIARIETLFLNF